MQKVFFSSKDVILIFEACGIVWDMDTQSMGHSCGPSPWTTLVDHPLIFVTPPFPHPQ